METVAEISMSRNSVHVQTCTSIELLICISRLPYKVQSHNIYNISFCWQIAKPNVALKTRRYQINDKNRATDFYDDVRLFEHVKIATLSTPLGHVIIT
jgi:hypothetical protein